MATLEEARRLESLAEVRRLEQQVTTTAPVTAGPLTVTAAPEAETAVPGLATASSGRSKPFREFFKSDIAKEVTIASGAFAGAELGAKIPLPPNMKVLAGIAGAGIGGTAAAFGFSLGGAFTEGQSLADIEFGNIAAHAGKRGVEELLFEGGGQLFIKGGKLGIKALARKISGSSKDEQVLAQAVLDQKGTGLSLGRAADSSLFRFVDDALRSSPATSKMFEDLDLANEQAFRTLLNTEIAHLSGQELKSLSPNRIGLFAIDAIKGGDNLFSKLMERHYAKMDELVPSGVIKAEGAPFGQLVDPVDMTDSITFAQKKLDNQLTKRISQSDEADAVLRDLEDLIENPRLSFSEAHKFRSDILALKRDLPLDLSAKGKSQAIALINSTEDIVTRAMNDAVDEFGTLTAKRHLNMLNKEWKNSKGIFNSEFVGAVLKKKDEASKVGEWMFASDGSPERIKGVYKAIDEAASNSKKVERRLEAAKGADTAELKELRKRNTLSVKEAAQVKKRLQGQYLRGRLTLDSADIGSSDIFKILTDSHALDQFKAAIPNVKHQDAIIDLLKAVRVADQKTLATGGRSILGITMTRLGIASAGGVAAGGTVGAAGGSSGEVAGGGLGGTILTLGGIVFSTRAVAKIFTNPRLVRELTGAAKLAVTSPRAGSVIARLGSEINQFLADDAAGKFLFEEEKPKSTPIGTP